MEEWADSNIAAPPGLSQPEQLWCPRCKIHLRHQDGYSSAQHKLLEVCPVCADELGGGVA